MDLKQLKYFLTVVDERQITAAARKLHMAQPPLSQQMKLLESELGTELSSAAPIISSSQMQAACSPGGPSSC